MTVARKRTDAYLMVLAEAMRGCDSEIIALEWRDIDLSAPADGGAIRLAQTRHGAERAVTSASDDAAADSGTQGRRHLRSNRAVSRGWVADYARPRD